MAHNRKNHCGRPACTNPQPCGACAACHAPGCSCDDPCRVCNGEIPHPEFAAYVMAADGESTVEVDLRTLPADRLQALRAEAGAAGDHALVDAVDSLPTSPN